MTDKNIVTRNGVIDFSGFNMPPTQPEVPPVPEEPFVPWTPPIDTRIPPVVQSEVEEDVSDKPKEVDDEGSHA